MMRKYLLLLMMLSTLCFPLFARSISLETDRSGVELTGVIGSALHLSTSLNYTTEYAFFLNEGIDNDKADYLVSSSDHGYQIGYWGLVSNRANTTVTFTHDKLKPLNGTAYGGVEYKLYIQCPKLDDLDNSEWNYCYSMEGGRSPNTFSVTYNTTSPLTSFSRKGLCVQLVMDSLSQLDADNAPSGEYVSTITLTATSD